MVVHTLHMTIWLFPFFSSLTKTDRSPVENVEDIESEQKTLETGSLVLLKEQNLIHQRCWWLRYRKPLDLQKLSAITLSDVQDLEIKVLG